MSDLFPKPIKGQNDADNVISYLNNQPDMLTAIIKHRTKQKGHLGDLFILPLPKTMDKMVIQTHPPPSRQPLEIEIPFEPPMQDFVEFRRRVLGYRDQAYKHFKVPSRPRIPYYSEPDLLPLTLPIILGISALAFATFGSGVYADKFRKLISDTFGPGMLPGAQLLLVTAHSLEAVYMAWAMFKHRVPFFSSILWVFTTALLGFAAMTEFWESVQYERLRHIYRQTEVGEIPPRVGGSDSKRVEGKTGTTKDSKTAKGKKAE